MHEKQHDGDRDRDAIRPRHARQGERHRGPNNEVRKHATQRQRAMCPVRFADDPPRSRMSGGEQGAVRGGEEHRHHEEHQCDHRPGEHQAALETRRFTRRSCFRHIVERVRVCVSG